MILEIVYTLRYGQFLMPTFLQAVFSEVSQTPSLFAASFNGKMKCSCRHSAVRSTGAGLRAEPSTSFVRGTILGFCIVVGIAVERGGEVVVGWENREFIGNRERTWCEIRSYSECFHVFLPKSQR
jgi:hypothetical protein